MRKNSTEVNWYDIDPVLFSYMGLLKNRERIDKIEKRTKWCSMPKIQNTPDFKWIYYK